MLTVRCEAGKDLVSSSDTEGSTENVGETAKGPKDIVPTVAKCPAGPCEKDPVLCSSLLCSSLWDRNDRNNFS